MKKSFKFLFTPFILFMVGLLVSCNTFKPSMQTFECEDYHIIVDSICLFNGLDRPLEQEWTENVSINEKQLNKQKVVFYKNKKRKYIINVLDTDTLDVVTFKTE